MCTSCDDWNLAFDLSEDERKLANESLFSRHPEMKTWPVDHHWQMGTIDVKDIWLIDIFGGASTIKVEDYDKVKAFTSVEKPSKSDPPSNPPAIDQKAQTARWLAHTADFGILSTTSVHLNGAPFGNPQSFCDGTTDNSTGKLYFYVSNLDASMQDVAQNDRVSFTLSEEFVHDSCMNQQIDPEDPRCVRLTFSGKIREISVREVRRRVKRNLRSSLVIPQWQNGLPIITGRSSHSISITFG